MIRCFLLLVVFSVQAQTYPSRPVRLIVPFPPGGAVEFYARAVQPHVAALLGQPVLIENRAGAGGMMGTDLVAKAPPDGHTLLVGNIAALAMNVGVYSKMPYDPVKDLTPIMRTVAVNYVDRKSTRLNSSHLKLSRMPSSA